MQLSITDLYYAHLQIIYHACIALEGKTINLCYIWQSTVP